VARRAAAVAPVAAPTDLAAAAEAATTAAAASALTQRWRTFWRATRRRPYLGQAVAVRPRRRPLCSQALAISFERLLATWWAACGTCRRPRTLQAEGARLLTTSKARGLCWRTFCAAAGCRGRCAESIPTTVLLLPTLSHYLPCSMWHSRGPPRARAKTHMLCWLTFACSHAIGGGSAHPFFAGPLARVGAAGHAQRRSAAREAGLRGGRLGHARVPGHRRVPHSGARASTHVSIVPPISMFLSLPCHPLFPSFSLLLFCSFVHFF
jgi:hypothetical protein